MLSIFKSPAWGKVNRGFLPFLRQHSCCEVCALYLCLFLRRYSRCDVEGHLFYSRLSCAGTTPAEFECQLCDGTTAGTNKCHILFGAPLAPAQPLRNLRIIYFTLALRRWRNHEVFVTSLYRHI